VEDTLSEKLDTLQDRLTEILGCSGILDKVVCYPRETLDYHSSTKFYSIRCYREKITEDRTDMRLVALDFNIKDWSELTAEHMARLEKVCLEKLAF
jgi:hypothetical protein